MVFQHPYILVPYIFFATFIASGAGTGGGALYMPAYVMACKGNTHIAVPLSKATIFGLAVGSFLCTIFQKLKKKESINTTPNYTAAALLEPPTLLGIIFGVDLNLILPSTITLISLIIWLFFIACITIKKAFQLYKKEALSNSQSQSFQYNSVSDAECCKKKNVCIFEHSQEKLTEPLLFANNTSALTAQICSDSAETEKGDNFKNRDTNANSISTTASTCITLSPADENYMLINETASPMSSPCRDMASEEPCLINRKSYSNLSLAYMIIFWATTWLALYINGGPITLFCGTFKQRCVVYSLVICQIIAIFSYISFCAKEYEKQKYYLENERISTSFQTIEWMSSRKHLSFYSLCAFFAGIGAGSVGLGGGVIKGPLMICMGLSPLSAVSTAIFMLLFTSSSTLLSFSLAGRLKLHDFLLFGSTALIGSLCGVHCIRYLVQKYKLQSIVTFFLSFIIVLSMVSLIGSTVLSIDYNLFLSSNFASLDQTCQSIRSAFN